MYKRQVYGITKVEFLNIGGSVVKSYNDQIVAVAELKSAIEKAEAIDSKKYTAESYAKPVSYTHLLSVSSTDKTKHPVSSK